MVEPVKMPSRFAIPSWLLSLLMHAALIVVLGLIIRVTPQGSAAEEQRTGGIVLAYTNAQGEVTEYDDGGDASSSDSDRAFADSNLPTPSSLHNSSLVNTDKALPQGQSVIGLGQSSGGSLVPDAGGLTKGSRPGKGLKGGQATTRVFGVEGTGSRFVYVFDRSGSMGGSGHSPLRAAQSELLASLESLGTTHQFQIIFYNQKPTIFNPAGGSRLSFGTEQNKELARKFVEGITADGGTQHEDALLAAINLGPDVIFFLTDADQPGMSAAALDDIRRKNGGRASINAIEFGLGPSLDAENFISRLARQNGGQYNYVDVTQLGRGR